MIASLLVVALLYVMLRLARAKRHLPPRRHEYSEPHRAAGEVTGNFSGYGSGWND